MDNRSYLHSSSVNAKLELKSAPFSGQMAKPSERGETAAGRN